MEIKTSNGVTVDFEAAVNMMNDELREFVHAYHCEGTSPQEFFDIYATVHFENLGEDFESIVENM